MSIPELWEQSHTIAIGEVLGVDSTLVSLLVNNNLKLDWSPSDTLYLHIPSRVNWISCENGVYKDLAANENPFVEGEEYLIFADASNRIRCMGYSENGFFLLHTFSLHTMTQTVELVIRPQIGVLTYDDLQKLQCGLPPDTSYSIHSNLQFPLLDENVNFEMILYHPDVVLSSNMFRPREYITQSDLKSINGLECYVHMGQRSSASFYSGNESNVFVSVLAPSGVRIQLRGNIESFEDDVFNIRLYSKRNCMGEW